jgi:hypothetical protein
LPEEVRETPLDEIARRLGAGLYASIPDFTDSSMPDANVHRALGLLSSETIPYDVVLRDVEYRVQRDERHMNVEYLTPYGPITTATVFTDEMLEAGASVSWVTKQAICGPQDFEAAGWIFSRAEVVARPERFLALKERVGSQGEAVAYTLGTACPLHLILKELMTVETFFYALNDYPAKIARLCEHIEPVFQAVRRIGLELPAEVVFLGANYDDSITYPSFFRQHFLPPLRIYAQQVHARGGYLMTHTDGENRRLLSAYLECEFDIADSVCPAPMTRCSLDELYEAFRDRITIWGGIPSILLCRQSATWEEFKDYVDRVVKRYRGKSRLILGVSDMVTADCEWDRLRYIGERVNAN